MTRREEMVDRFKALVSSANISADSINYLITDDSYICIYAFAIVVRGINVDQYVLCSTGEVRVEAMRTTVEDKSWLLTVIKA